MRSADGNYLFVPCMVDDQFRILGPDGQPLKDAEGNFLYAPGWGPGEGLQRDQHGNIIVTRNVFITATTNRKPGQAPDGEELPPFQEDQLNQARRGLGPGGEGNWNSGGYYTHTTTQREYKTEKDGMIETRIERKIQITSDDEIDHDAALAEAIRQVTDMNPDLSVEKIEIQTKTETEAD
jgi:hypothetical protein